MANWLKFLFVKRGVSAFLIAFLSHSVDAFENKPLQPNSSMFSEVKLPQVDYQWIAQRVYQNECASKPENLLFWNSKEPFPSLGIGHFIWFPNRVEVPFEQTFPDFLRFVQSESPEASIPISESEFSIAPWQDREVFYALKELGKLNQWQAFLQNTFGLQAQFIVHRLQSKLPEVLAQVPADKRDAIYAKMHALMQSEKGLFALIDYSNFKGLGINPKERYRNKGWGLLQVLGAMEMPQSQTEDVVVNAFVRAAKQTLKLRTERSPNPELETTWLKGWFKRLDAYQ